MGIEIHFCIKEQLDHGLWFPFILPQYWIEKKININISKYPQGLADLLNLWKVPIKCTFLESEEQFSYDFEQFDSKILEFQFGKFPERMVDLLLSGVIEWFHLYNFCQL